MEALLFYIQTIAYMLFIGIPYKAVELGVRGSIFAGKKILSLFSNKENNDIKHNSDINNKNEDAISDEVIAELNIEEKKILKMVESLDKKIKESDNNQENNFKKIKKCEEKIIKKDINSNISKQNDDHKVEALPSKVLNSKNIGSNDGKCSNKVNKDTKEDDKPTAKNNELTLMLFINDKKIKTIKHNLEKIKNSEQKNEEDINIKLKLK